jgi:hypothetical protein
LSCKAGTQLGGEILLKHLKVADDAQPGRPVETSTKATMQRVENLIRVDRRITIDSVATALGCSHGITSNIMHNHLKFRKVFTVDEQRTEGSRKNESNGSVLATFLTICKQRRRYA